MAKKNFFKETFFVTVILISLLISAYFFKTTVQGSIKNPVKSYITITVQANDTLWDISKEYMNDNYYYIHNYIDEIIIINALDSSKIYPGDKLILPIVN